MTDPKPRAPCAYHDKDQPNGIAWCPGWPEALRDISPLYDQAALDAAVAAERERWALAFDAMREKALAEQAGPSGDLANIMLRQVAELGFGECARAIRAVGNEA
jgi:hypothetical protein